MFSRNNLIIVFIIILMIWGVSFGIRVYEKQDQFQLKNIPYQKISYIEVLDRGLVGKQVIFFRNRDSITQISKLLVGSEPVNADTINWKNNNGMCEIVLHYPDRRNTALTYANMRSAGGIISSGSYNYRNDTLLRVFVKRFKEGK